MLIHTRKSAAYGPPATGERQYRSHSPTVEFQSMTNDTVPQSTTSPKEPVTQSNTVTAFSLNHPKNYFGVPLAVAATADTDQLIRAHLVQMEDRARAGAEALGLITEDTELTTLGETIVETVATETAIEDELETFGDMKGSSERFIEAAPRYWNPIARHVLQQSTLVGDVVTLLESTGPVTLPELTAVAVRTNHCVQDIVLRDADSLTASDVQPDPPASLRTPDVYAGQAVYQFKNLLFHTGILTERGADTSALVPSQDVWALDPSLVNLGGDR